MMITTGSYTGTGSDQDTNDLGIPNNHAFSIFRALTVTDASNVEHRLLEMRNPWGIEQFIGDWSMTSDLWTDDLLSQVGHTLEDDGVYFLSYSDYLNNMEYSDLSYDTSTWHHAGFAVFDDDEPYEQMEVFGDGVLYNIHTLTITSPVQ